MAVLHQTPAHPDKDSYLLGLISPLLLQAQWKVYTYNTPSSANTDYLFHHECFGRKLWLRTVVQKSFAAVKFSCFKNVPSAHLQSAARPLYGNSHKEPSLRAALPSL